ncbi:MAG: hypothetical protein J2P31_21445 [Blastocatellia bacterium]|nr:hypothetical protein [Blastocatellia bacterium]
MKLGWSSSLKTIVSVFVVALPLSAITLGQRMSPIDYEIAFTPLSLYYYFNKSESAISIPQTMVFHANGSMVERLVGYNESDYKRVMEKAISGRVGEWESRRAGERGNFHMLLSRSPALPLSVA